MYAVDYYGQVWASFDEGASWTELTKNLPTLSRGIRTLEFFNPNTATDNTVLIAGGYDGVFQMSQPATAANPTWSALSGNLPHALVTSLHYDYKDNVLVAGTVGRGVWTLTGAFPGGAATAPVAAATTQPIEPAAGTIMMILPPRPDLPPVVAPPADYPQR